LIFFGINFKTPKQILKSKNKTTYLYYMGTCVAKEFKAPIVSNNLSDQEKEDQEHN